MRSFAPGLTFALDGEFADKVFYVEPNLDVLNRVQFRVITWHGKSDEDGGGGWWHFDSIVHDRDRIVVYTEVTSIGAEEALTIPWSELDEEQDETRQEELGDEGLAWKWVSRELMKPLGFRVVDPAEVEDADCEEFRKVADDIGFAKLIQD